MALYGSLKEMSVADLIQHNCQDRKTAQLTVERNGKKAQIFFREGAIVHATLGPVQGEEAVYQALTWDDGKFVLETGTPSPAVTIQRSWSSILLEGAKRADEGQDETTPIGLGGRRARAVNDILITFLTNTKIFKGAVVTDLAGAVRAACIENQNDQEIFSSISAATLNFGTRTLKLTSYGKFGYMILVGEEGSILVMTVNATTLLLALSDVKAAPSVMLEELSKVCLSLADFA